MSIQLLQGDCLERMAEMDAESIAAIDEELQNMEPSAGPGDHLTD